jgi:hypothetical protein
VTVAWPRGLRRLAEESCRRLARRLSERAPSLAEPTLGWMRGLARGLPPHRYFTHPDALPLLLLPWWLEERIAGSADRAFQADLAYSTISAYYAVRLIDDSMDADRPPPPEVMPASIVFQLEFIGTYQSYFEATHPFWDDLAAAWIGTAEMASRDAALGAPTRRDFIDVAARKTIGARVPIAAVAHRHGRPELLADWYRFLDAFGRWHQMQNDIGGWREDLAHGRRTYFLSRAPSTTPTGIASWVVTDGLGWGAREAEAMIDDAVSAARPLESRPLLRYLEGRRRAADATWQELLPAVEALRSATLSARAGTRAPAR